MFQSYVGYWSKFRKVFKRDFGRHPTLEQFSKHVVQKNLDSIEALQERQPWLPDDIEAVRPMLGRVGDSRWINDEITMLSCVAEMVHYSLGHKVITLSREVFDMLASAKHDVSLSELAFPLPIFEVCTPDDAFIVHQPQVTFASETLAQTVFSGRFLESGYRADSLKVEIPMSYSSTNETGVRSAHLPMINSQEFLDKMDREKTSYDKERTHRILRAAVNLMVYFHVDGSLLPGGKIHGRPKMGKPPDILTIPLEKAAHFRSGHYRTLRKERYYRGKKYPPKEWRIIRVKPSLVKGKQTKDAREANEILDMEKKS